MIDVFDPRIYSQGIPHERYRLLRDEHPVYWQEEHEVGDWPAGPGFWAVTRHADVVRVLRTPTGYSSWIGATQIRDPDPADLSFIRRMMLNLDPPDHGRLRRIVSGAFTPVASSGSPPGSRHGHGRSWTRSPNGASATCRWT
ncbi:hypothetical protein ACFQYP_32520 [Nonomuraea antimicrobica]